jgi:hypothetical protein
MGDAIHELIEELIVDAYGEHEQLWSSRQAFEDRARLPFPDRVIGVDIEVMAVDFDSDDRRGLVAACRLEGEQHRVSLLDVSPAGPVHLETRQLIEAYRRWWGAAPLTVDPPPAPTTWAYPVSHPSTSRLRSRWR